ncbi:hypothetical protein FAGKG844_90030 [Frankia sp. AgKG'84/4]
MPNTTRSRGPICYPAAARPPRPSPNRRHVYPKGHVNRHLQPNSGLGNAERTRRFRGTDPVDSSGRPHFS